MRLLTRNSLLIVISCCCLLLSTTVFCQSLYESVSSHQKNEYQNEHVRSNDNSPLAQSSEPSLIPSGGIFADPLQVRIACEDTNATIYFTTDGSEPSEISIFYTDPIELDSSTVIRAISISEDAEASEIKNETYIIGYVTELPIVSLITDPDNLWSEERGIYITGPNANEAPPYYGANYWQDWERPVHVDFFEPDGEKGFSLGMGLKIFGGWSRIQPQKSLRITARDEYGEDRINYQVFPDCPVFCFKSLILRNAGNDWNAGMLRDALMTGLVQSEGIDVQAYRPAVVYLNGEYWGIHNLRERIDEHYLKAHYGYDAQDVDIIENYNTVEAGDSVAYQQFREFIDNHDLSNSEAYDSVQTMINIENFIRYQASEIYFANTDWPVHNIRAWRCPDGTPRFRWFLYDTDFGFDLQGRVHHNTLEYATDPDGPNWPNPPYSTLALRRLLENKNFRDLFIKRFCDLMNTAFEVERVTQHLSELVNGIADEMPVHEAKWYPDHNWEDHLTQIENFARNRNTHVVSHLRDKFDLGDMYSVNIIEPGIQGGRISVNGHPVEELPWSGNYFHGLYININAEPFAGYQFAGWEGDINSDYPNIRHELEWDLNLQPVFEAAGGCDGEIIITEINYQSSDECDPGDWIEIYAASGSHDLSRWRICDEDADNYFDLPRGVFLHEDCYIVLAEDLQAFTGVFPEVEDVYGDWGFGLCSEGDQIRLLDAYQNLMDSVAFQDHFPWPFQPNGTGMTLQLVNPALANEYAHNWGVSLSMYGDPGEANHTFRLESRKKNSSIPEEFSICQTYPNPFNSKVTVVFTLNHSTEIHLGVYNITGRKIKSLLEDQLSAGRYHQSWSSHGLSNGMYIIYLETEYGSDRRKVLLIK